MYLIECLSRHGAGALHGRRWRRLHERGSWRSVGCPASGFPFVRANGQHFSGVGDVNRLRLLSVLSRQEMCVTELTETLEDNLPAISQRLKLLRAERLVRSRRQGKHVYYRLADEHIAELISNGLAHGSEPHTQ